MEPPKVIEVGPYTFQVVLDADAIESIRKKEKSDTLVGYMDGYHQVITIDPRQGPDMVADTVLHEIIHACWLTAGAITLGNHLTEEQIVSILTPTLLGTLRKSPELVEFLTKGSDG